MLTNDELRGRDREIALLRRTAVTGREQGAALVVIGEPGIGKTALLDATRVGATEAGYTVLQTAGVESELHLPFAAVHRLVTPLLLRLAGLPVVQRDALATAIGLSDRARPDLFLVAEATWALLHAAREDRPVLVVADDVQWLDASSHQVLAFLAHRGTTSRIGVIGAVRHGHPGPFPNAGFPELVVRGLDDRTATELLNTHHAGLGAADRARIRHQAQGNPLALLELPRSRHDGEYADGNPVAVSARLEHAFVGRISALPAGTRDALLVAAVGSSSRVAEVVAALSKFGTPDASADLLDPARDAGLISCGRDDVTFRHPLVRSGVVARETLTRRQSAHAALAAAPGLDLYRRSWHRAWSIVGPDDAIADALVETAKDAVRRGAAMAAVAGLERAAQLTTRPDQRGSRLVRAAGLAFDTGRPDVVARLLHEASFIALSELDEVRVTRLRELLNDDVRADCALVRMLCEAARRAGALGDDGLALDLLLGAALRCWWADSGADSAEVIAVLDRVGTSRHDPRHLAALAIAEPVRRGPDVLAGLGAAQLDDVDGGDALRVFGLAAYGVGDLVLATDLLDRAEQAFRRQGRLGMLPVVLALQVQIRLDLGDWSGSLLAGQEVVTLSRETGQDVYAANHVLVEARGLALRGEWRAALGLMAEAEAEAVGSMVDDRICLAYQARGAALLTSGRPEEAFDTLRRQYDPSDPGHHLRESFAGFALTAEAAVACDRVTEARALLDHLDAVAVVTPSPLLAVNLLYARAVLAPGAQRDARYRSALAADLRRWPWMRARVELAAGQWFAQTGRRREADRLLHCALVTFERLGAVTWARSAASSLRGPHNRGPGPR